MEHIRTHAHMHMHMHMHMHAWYVHICTCTCTRWEVTRETRQSGNSEGTTDLYYHSGTPRAAGVKRFRSRAEVARHLGLAGSATRAKPFAKLGVAKLGERQAYVPNSKGQGGFVLAAPARESNAAVIARSPELQRMRQMALEQQRQLREHHAAQVSQVMAQATQAAQAQATQAARAALGVQAAQGVQGAPLQLVTHGVGPHAFVATHGAHAKVVAAQQAYAQQMAQLVARHEQQIAAACRRALLPYTPTVTAHDTYGCSPWCLRLQLWTLQPAVPTVAAHGTYGCRRVLEQHEVAMAEQVQQAELRSVVDGLVRGVERAQERARAEAVAEAELTCLRLCEYCGRKAFKSTIAHGKHKSRCFEQLCTELAAATGASDALKVRLRVNGTQHELQGAMARGRRRPGAEAAEGGTAPAADDAPRLVCALLVVGRQCPSTKLRDTYRGASHGGGEGLVSLKLSVLLKPRQRKVAKRFSKEEP